METVSRSRESGGTVDAGGLANRAAGLCSIRETSNEPGETPGVGFAVSTAKLPYLFLACNIPVVLFKTPWPRGRGAD